MAAYDVQAGAPDAGDEESRRWHAWRASGDEAAREALLAQHLPYARVIAAMVYTQRSSDDIDFEDYHQLARVGLLEAFDRYDPEGGAGFRTFAAQRIRGAVLDGLVHMTERQQQQRLWRRILAERTASIARRTHEDGAQDALRGQGGTAPTSARQDAAGSGRGVDDLFHYLAEVGVGLALGFLLEDTGMFSAGEDVVAGGDSPYRAVELRQTRRQLRLLVRQLPAAERRVIQLHYEQGQAFDHIARDMALSKGRISQIHRKALGTLRTLLTRGPDCDRSF